MVNMRISGIASGVEYRMDERFQNLPIFRAEFLKKFHKFVNFQIIKFWKFVNFSIRKIPKNSLIFLFKKFQ